MTELRRLLRIVYISLRYRLDELFYIFPWQHLPLWLKLLLLLNPARLLPARNKPLAVRLRLALEALGPVFIKFGQILSTRRDVLRPDIAEELQSLQDKIPPFTEDAVALTEAALGQPVAEIFAHFDSLPMASASVAQVHAAWLLDGSEVVVKIIRPGIAVVIQRDIKLLYAVAALAERFFVDASRLHLKRIVADYEATITGELNLLFEAANTAKLRRNFARSELLYVPRVHWQHCRENLLVLEKIQGMPIGRIDALKAAGTDMRVLAERGVEVFFTQVFQHNFFHADMHPGNIFVDLSDPASPSYIAVDCAIIGSLTAAHKHYLAHNLLAFFKQDYRKVASLHIESGWVAPDTDINEFEAVIRDVCEPIFQRPLSEISFGHFVITLFDTARQFKMEVQPELILLQKTLLNIEGLGRQLYPELDLWATARPLLERWLVDQVGPVALFRNLAARTPDLLDVMPSIPGLLADGSAKLSQLQRKADMQEHALRLVREQGEKQAIRLGRQGHVIFMLTAAAVGLSCWLLWAFFGVDWRFLALAAAFLFLLVSRI